MLKQFKGIEKIGMYISYLCNAGYQWVHSEKELTPGTFFPGDGLETLIVYERDEDYIEDIIEPNTIFCELKTDSGYHVAVDLRHFADVCNSQAEYVGMEYFLKYGYDWFRN